MAQPSAGLWLVLGVWVVLVAGMASPVRGGPYYYRFAHANVDAPSGLVLYINGQESSPFTGLSRGGVSPYIQFAASETDYTIGLGATGASAPAYMFPNVTVPDDGLVKFTTVVLLDNFANSTGLVLADTSASQTEAHAIRFVNLAHIATTSMRVEYQSRPVVVVTDVPAFVDGTVAPSAYSHVSVLRNETLYDFFRPTGGSTAVASSPTLALPAGLATTVLVTQDNNVYPLLGEFVQGRVLDQLVDLEGGVVTRALTISDGISVTVSADTVVADTITFSGTGALEVNAALTVGALVTLNDQAVLAVNDVALTVQSLTAATTALVSFKISSLEPTPIVVKGAATLSGNIRVVIPSEHKFRKDTQYTVLTCSPCIGSFANVSVVLLTDASARSRSLLQSLVVSESVALVSCSTQSCVVTAGDGLPVQPRLVNTPTSTDKIVIAVFLFTLAFLAFVAFCVRKWWLIRGESRRDPSKYYEVNKHLQELEPTRKALKDQHLQDMDDDGMHSTGIYVSPDPEAAAAATATIAARGPDSSSSSSGYSGYSGSGYSYSGRSYS